MKISKLFHWLYAILMLLPILVFIPNAFYYGFNKESVAQEKTEQVPVYYETNEIVTTDDFHVGYVYTYLDNYTPSSMSSVDLFNITYLTYPYANKNGTLYYNTSGQLIFWFDNAQHNVLSNRFDFLIRNTNAQLPNLPSNLLQYFIECNNQYIKEYLPLVTNMSITDSMSYAWVSVWQNDLFSWSYGSFLTQPFIYIGNLFNVPVDNTLYYALSYWLDISIIWLTFDLLMYVPLLVHRWLDKGIIE